MKHLSLVILYLLFFHVNGWADNVPINLCKQINGGINDRSMSIELTASHDLAFPSSAPPPVTPYR